MKSQYSARVRFVIVQGTIMLSLGALLSLLAEGLCSHTYDKVALCSVLTSIFIAISVLAFHSLQAEWLRSNLKRNVRILIATGIFALAGMIALRPRHAQSPHPSPILIAIGVLGLFWGVLHIVLAFKVSSFRKTSAAIAASGAMLSASGTVLCSLSGINPITATTVAACFSTWIGFALLSTAPVLFWNWRIRDHQICATQYKMQSNV